MEDYLKESEFTNTIKNYYTKTETDKTITDLDNRIWDNYYNNITLNTKHTSDYNIIKQENQKLDEKLKPLMMISLELRVMLHPLRRKLIFLPHSMVFLEALMM